MNYCSNMAPIPLELFHNGQTLQQKVSLYAKWFHWILNEFAGYNERDLVGT
jgi:hypothetical protein